MLYKNVRRYIMKLNGVEIDNIPAKQLTLNQLKLLIAETKQSLIQDLNYIYEITIPNDSSLQALHKHIYNGISSVYNEETGNKETLAEGCNGFKTRVINDCFRIIQDTPNINEYINELHLKIESQRSIEETVSKRYNSGIGSSWDGCLLEAETYKSFFLIVKKTVLTGWKTKIQGEIK
jgi:hypothetical protein